jgi:hypothetical protein
MTLTTNFIIFLQMTITFVTYSVRAPIMINYLKFNMDNSLFSESRWRSKFTC